MRSPPASTSRLLRVVAGFQVSISGRFWVSTEADGRSVQTGRIGAAVTSASSQSVSRAQQLRMDKAIEAAAASPDYVLEVLRESHRHQCSFDPEADPTVELSFGSSVAEWRNACDLLGTKKLAEALNDIWGLTIPSSDWQAVLEPARSRTLRDVCGLIASQAQQARMLNAGHFGASSRSAGAFLAIRSLLLRAGADPGTIRPSLPIAELARRFPRVFLGPIARLAPGRLPTVVIRTPTYNAATATFGLGLVGLLGLSLAKWFGFAAWYSTLAAMFAVVAGIGYLGTWIAARWVGPAAVSFGNVVTFRDLAEVLAAEEPRELSATARR
jgi:hypothetical protein